MFNWPLTLLSRFGVIALAGYIAWLGWQNLGPRKPEIGPARQQLADKVIPEIAEDIRNSRQNIGRAALLHFTNDPSDYFTNALRNTIEQRGILDLHDRTFTEKLRNVLNMRHPSYPSAKEALIRGNKLGAEAVLHGTIHVFESFPEGSKIDVETHLAEVSTGKPIFSKRYSVQAPFSPPVSAVLKGTLGSFPWIKRLMGFAVIMLLLPVFTISFIRAMVRKNSNKTNAFVLSVYTLADAFLAWILIGAGLTSWFPVLVFIAAVSAALLYNIRIMTLALKLEEE